MKPVLFLTVFITFASLHFQVDAVESKKLSDFLTKELQQFGHASLKQKFTTLFSALTTLKNEMDDIKVNNKLVKLNIFELIQQKLGSCNVDEIENKFEELINVTVDFLINVSGGVENICSQVYNCANDSFPESLGCFLQLGENCQPYIQDIEEKLTEFIPQAENLGVVILTDLTNCLP